MDADEIKEKIIKKYEELRRAIDAGTPMDSAILAAAVILAEMIAAHDVKVDHAVKLIEELTLEAHDYDEAEMEGRATAYSSYKRRKSDRESRTRPRR